MARLHHPAGAFLPRDPAGPRQLAPTRRVEEVLVDPVRGVLDLDVAPHELTEVLRHVGQVDGLVNVVHVFNPYEKPEDPSAQEEMHLAELHALTDPMQIPRERVHLRAGSPVDVLPALAAELGVNVTLMGAIARSRLSNVIVGSTAENVLDRLQSDVLVVKPQGFVSPMTFDCAPDEATLAV